MISLFRRRVYSLSSALVLCSVSVAAQTTAASPHTRQIEDLLHRMTLEEKAGQLTQFASGILTGPGFERANDEEMIRRGEVGSLLGVVGAQRANQLQHIAMDQSRLHIPLIFGLDVIHGHRTVYPMPIGMAATFDPALVQSAAHMAAAEARADGIQWVFSPMVDISRDGRWGRIAESAGEDPYLGSRMAEAYVHGYQGSRLDAPDSVAACVKHFAAYGASLAGRDYNTVDMSDTQLNQVYLPPYRAAVNAGAATVMTSFSTLNGIPPTARHDLLTDTLRRDWGFRGFVVSDWGAVAELIPHGIAANASDAASLSIQAGTDMDMESDAYRNNLPQLVRSGKLPEAVVNEAVRRVLAVKYQLGLFDHPYVSEQLAYTATPEKRALARKAAVESFVLLKNDLDPTPSGSSTGAAQELFGASKRLLLPLADTPGKRYALVGPLADAAPQMLGSWSASGNDGDVRTLRTALQQRLGDRLLFAPGTDFRSASQAGFAAAVEAARHADVAILALGEDGPVMTGEGSSRASLDLPGNQQQLLEAVAGTGKPIVLLLFSGRPLAVPWAAHHAAAIVQAWFPGIEAGPALADVLFGEAVPSGRLPVEFPYSTGQEPLFLAQLPTGRPVTGVDLSHAPKDGDEKSHSRYIDEYNEPVFPFGWGLSYTEFAYGTPQVSLGGTPATVRISTEVRNSGTRAADEVVQLYFHRQVSIPEQPVRELKGFQRIHLKPGESRVVSFDIGQKDIAFYAGSALRTGIDGTLDFWVGPSSAAVAHVQVQSRRGEFVLKGRPDEQSAGL